VSARRLSHALLLAAFVSGCGSLGSPKPAWELPAPPAPESAVVPADRLHRAQLENGMRLLLLEDKRLPRIGFGIAFRRGEASLPLESAGLASFTAELMERGAGERDALAFAETIDRLGASVSASASWDSLVVGASGLSRDTDTLLDLLADVVRRPRFDPDEAKRAKGELLAALEQAREDPGSQLSWNLARAVYAGHRYGLPLSGTPQTVARFDAAAARALHAKLALPNDAIFFAAGDFDAASMQQRVRARFGDWKPGEPLPHESAPPAPAPSERKIVIVDRPEMAQTRIAVSHDGIARSAADRIPVALMNTVIGGGGFSSRLMERLRSDSGLTYSVYADYSLRRSPGPFVASTFTTVPETRRVVDLLLAELARGKSEPPSDDELAWARTLTIGGFAMGLETSGAVVQSLVDLDLYGLPEDSLDTFRGRVRAATAEEVAQAANEHLHPERAAIILVGPAEKLEPMMRDLAPIEVVKP
jgi:zinc protease